MVNEDKWTGRMLVLGTDENVPAAEREMSCILRIEIDELKEKTVGALLDICKTIAPDYVMKNPNCISKATVQWNKSETKKAFELLLHNII